MSTLNLGILAHVDAGKTSLTERLLFAAGVIDEVGRVDDGSTQTDSLALERQRGITIKSAVVSFVLDDVTVNLIDTPGHPDFIAEVERVLCALDGAVLVISAVEGVQAQTRVLMRTLQRLRIPTLIFVNKIDRDGARYEGVLKDIAAKLTPSIIAMGSADDLGTRSGRFTAYGSTDPVFTAGLVELLADHDDAFLAAYVADESAVSYSHLRRELAAQTSRCVVHPVYFGSAITGAGMDPLISGLTELLPASDGGADGPASGTVFKVERGPAGEKIAYVRMFAGTLRTRDRLHFGDDRKGKVTRISVFEHGAATSRSSVAAGQIAKLWGLAEVRIGDDVGSSSAASDPTSKATSEPTPEATETAVGRRSANGGGYFSPPTLESVVSASRPADKGVLHAALTELAEQDPLINLRQDDIRQEIHVSLYGEVQKEVIQATLAGDYGVDVTFRETTTICIERPVGTGAAAEFMGQETNPFRATVGLRVEPAPVGTGVEFRLGIELGSLPFSFLRAVEETVRETLLQGIHGWQVTDCTVTITHSGYTPPPPYGWSKASSSAGDFRRLTPLVLMSALQQAGTQVFEPMHHFRLEFPADALGSILPNLARMRAAPHSPSTRGSASVLEGEIPAAQVHELQQRLPALTRGEGVLECAFDRYEPVRGPVPARPRTDHNPLNRKEYLQNIGR
ncbi:translation factor GTPase family protein [Actinopolymorpha sp. B11F2]|uniref:translation factor GTPase family protein n=1 Tax=Actinopolymorpha sp. B11F2 TaxID=3160862 RepID=UPI0032E3D342